MTESGVIGKLTLVSDLSEEVDIKVKTDDGAREVSPAMEKVKRINPGRFEKMTTQQKEGMKRVKVENMAGKTRPCGKPGCPMEIPICDASAIDGCVGNGYTARWYHISDGEHYCNPCFEHFYRNHGISEPTDGYQQYLNWRNKWVQNGCTEPSLKAFIVDQCLPFWAVCVDCKKWRQIIRSTVVTSNFLQKFTCKDIYPRNRNACDEPEDERVAAVDESDWVKNLLVLSMMHASPAAEFLSDYMPDLVGLSAFLFRRVTAGQSTGRDQELMQPFYKDDSSGEIPNAFSFPPQKMLPIEVKHFPSLAKCPMVYCNIRNVVIAMWYKNCKEWITVEKCSHQLVCRGMMRILMCRLLPKVLGFLTHHSFANWGLVRSNMSTVSLRMDKGSVLVIGAGAAGLSAANLLQQWGVQVTVLEASSRIGGRISDSNAFPRCVSLSCQLINCYVNNPLTILCKQLDEEMWPVSSNCKLFSSDGQAVAKEEEDRMEFHFNAILDFIQNSREGKSKFNKKSLSQKIQETHEQFVLDTGLGFTDAQLRLFNFQIGNLESAIGSSLDDVSPTLWDSAESLPQFAGGLMFPPSGFGTLLKRLADGLDIRTDHKVTKVNYLGDEVTVHTEHGAEFVADRVLVAVPLSVLQRNVVHFVPDLLAEKVKAIERLGCGVVEKIALRFASAFWTTKAARHSFFGMVPDADEERCLFTTFHVVPSEEGDLNVLVSQITGDALRNHWNDSDQQLCDLAVGNLRKIFPGEEISIVSWNISNWRKDDLIGMAYSFYSGRCTGDESNILAKPIEDKLYFAGEATTHQFMQTLSGAILSGMREASKIVELDLMGVL